MGAETTPPITPAAAAPNSEPKIMMLMVLNMKEKKTATVAPQMKVPASIHMGSFS